MNITPILKAVVRQGLAEAQDARAVVIDAHHLLTDFHEDMGNCARVVKQYSDAPTVVEWVSSQTILRAANIVAEFIHRNEDAWLDEYEAHMAEDHESAPESSLTVDEAMAALRKWFTDPPQ